MYKMSKTKQFALLELDSDEEDILPEADIFSNRAANIFSTRKVDLNICFDDDDEDVKPVENDKEDDIMSKIKEKLDTSKAAARGRRKAGRGRKRKVEILNEEEIEDIKNESPSTIGVSPIKLPLASRKILNRLESENNRDEKRVNEEVKRILASCDLDFDLDNSGTLDQSLEINIALKFRYKHEIFQLEVHEKEKFLKIYPQVADHFKLKANEILLCKDDKTMNLEDSPDSLNLRFYDIIECISYNPTADFEVQDSNNSNFILKMQSNDTRKRIDIATHKLEKFSDIMERYSNRREIPLEKIIFEFDGERIEPDQTPDDLDMESGSCVDVKILGLAPMKSKPFPINPDDYKPIPKSQMLNICVLD